KILESEDPYPRELADTADAVSAELRIDEYRIAWQSAGRTGDDWLGPDLADVIRTLAEDGTTSIVSCPVGFVSDHLEVLYDVDIEAQEVSRKAGVVLVRTESPNDDPAFVAALADVVTERSEL